MMSQDASGSSETNLVRYPYRRGAKLVGADGQMVGTLEQLVVDRDSGVLRSLIVRSADGAREFELPEEHVSQNEGDTVRLSVGADELAANPELARPYNPREFQPVPPGEPTGHNRPSRVALQTGQPVVASAGDNADADRAVDRRAVEPAPDAVAGWNFSTPGAPSSHMPADEGLASNQVASSASQAMPPAAPSAEQGTPVTSPLAPSPPLQMQVPSWATSGVLATGISIGTGALAGVMMRRRQLRAERATKSARHMLTERLQAAGEQARDTAAQGGTAATQARRQGALSAKRPAKSGRWFRRGVLLGAALGILFAPQPGAQLRERLRESARQPFTHR